VSNIKAFGTAGKKTAVISTINGDSNVPFYAELSKQGVKSANIPVIAFSVGEEEISRMDANDLVGHLAAWNYFQSVPALENEEFIAKWRSYTNDPGRVTNDPIDAAVTGFNMWVKAVEKANTVNPDAVIEAIVGVQLFTLTGTVATMLPNHHITKPVMIGKVREDGQFDIVWQTDDVMPGDAWSDYIEETKDLQANWTPPVKCGDYNIKTKTCGHKMN
jgi:urea transport system substrate-binding protein